MNVVGVDPQRIDSEIIDQAAQLIRSGQLVAFPTETVYGLGANAFDAEAVGRIFAAKGRPATDPLIVHVQSEAQLADVTPHVPDTAHVLMDSFWPGPLTLVLPRSLRIPPNVSAGLPTVAVRMPAHPIALALIRASGVPIAAPSANRFAHTSPTSAQHVLDDLGGRVAMILDGGPTHIGVESTIVDVSVHQARLLRPGGVSLEALQQIVPDIDIVERVARPDDVAMPAPGMLLKHYSPRAEVRLFSGTDEALRTALLETGDELLKQGRRVGLLAAEEDRSALIELLSQGARMAVPGSLNDLDQVAHNLFARLRDLDSQDVDVILARAFAQHGIGRAIHDRLLRAAEGKIIQV